MIGFLTSLYYRLILLAERYMLIIVMFGVYGKISTQIDHEATRLASQRLLQETCS